MMILKMRFFLITFLIILFSCSDSDSMGGLDFNIFGNDNDPQFDIDIFVWNINIDSISDNSNYLQDTVYDSNGFHYIPLSANEGIHTLLLYGNCNISYNDSIYYPRFVYSSTRNIRLVVFDQTAYLKVIGSITVYDTVGSVTSTYSKDIYQFINQDTTYTIVDINNDLLISPIPENPIYPDSIGNYILELNVPSIIRGDTMSLDINPFGSISHEGSYLIQGRRFSLIFQ